VDDILKSCSFHPKPITKTKDGITTVWISTPWGLVRFHRPKIIVGVGLTTTYENSPTSRVTIFPAILDTGFNRTLAVDERHLQKILGKHSPTPLLPYTWKDGHGVERDCFDINQNMWIYRLPYHPDKRLHKITPETMYILRKTKTVRVVGPMKGTQRYPDLAWPPLPLLGLEALIYNQIHLFVDGKAREYRLRG
jgi:hypothetical protein